MKYSMAEAREVAERIRDEVRVTGREVRDRLPVVAMTRRRYYADVEERMSQGADLALTYGRDVIGDRTRPQLRLIQGGAG